MKVKKFLTFFLLITLFSRNENSTKKILTDSTGDQNEIILVIDDNGWKGAIGDTLRKIFQLEIDGLPQAEQFFNLVQINPSDFSRFFKTHKNIMFIGKDYKDSYTMNKWAKNQIVMYLNSTSNEHEFKKSCVKTFNFLYRKELENIRASYKMSHNTEARKHIKETFGINVFLPTEYYVSLKEKNVFISDFHSFNEKQDLLKYILIYDFFPDDNENIQKQIVSKIDSILKQQIKGSIEGTYVQIDKRMPITEINGLYRGMWTLENGFMAGPFIMKSRYIEDRIVISLGLVFHPNENKREYVRIFEAIL